MPDTPSLDINHGAGGAYVINPETGERELVERTQDAATTAEPETPAPAGAEE